MFVHLLLDLYALVSLTRLIDDHDWSIHSPFDEPDKKGVESGNNTPKFIDTRQGETPENPDICLPEWRYR